MGRSPRDEFGRCLSCGELGPCDCIHTSFACFAGIVRCDHPDTARMTGPGEADDGA